MLRSPVALISTLLKRYYSSLPIICVKDILKKKPIDEKILVQGWVQAVRKHKDLYFVDLVDGTCLDRLQIVISANDKCSPIYGSSIKVEGSIVKSLYKGQEIELIADSWNTIGPCAESYPFVYHQKHSAEYIRQLVHLRPRTRTFSSVLRVRNHASMAVHQYFQDEGFCFVHTPIITQNDCEGAGEVFTIETNEKISQISQDKNKERKKQNEVHKHANEEASSESNSDSSEKYFFGVPAYLTVSGQLHLEALSSALSRVYNFGPALRAESSKSRLHASEFQMIEAEVSFVESVDDLLKIVEDCLKKIAGSVMNSCASEISFLTQEVKNYDEYIKNIVSKPFIKMSYKDAISILQKNKDSLNVPIEFGEDLSTEHKLFLIKHCDNIPVFVCMFPSSIKPFYMKVDDNGMACCFDLLASYGGEICGGSLREDSEENLTKKFSFEDKSSLLWYLDLRKYGTVPHGGFGIGFERFLQSILGFQNIRDIIPFPRRKNDCKC